MIIQNNKYQIMVALVITILASGCMGAKPPNQSIPFTKDSGHLNNMGKGKTISDRFLSKLKSLPECSYFINNINPPTEKNIINCFERVLESRPPKGLVDFMKMRTNLNKLSKNTLEKLVKIFTALRARESEFIKNLVRLGAPTHHITIPEISDYGDEGEELVVGNTRNCETIEIIIRNNRKLYQKGKLFTGNSQGNNLTDLHNLVRTSDQWHICPEAVKLLVKYNPKMRDFNNKIVGTPLRQLLSDFSKANHDPKLAKILMTKTNVNISDKPDDGGNTPLHILLLYNASRIQKLKIKNRETIKAFLDMGVKIDIRNKDGITARDLILKRPDLKDL